MPTVGASHTEKRSFGHTLVCAAAAGSAAGFICFPFEGLKKKYQSGQPISFHPRELYRGSCAFSVSVMTATVGAMSAAHLLKGTPGYDPSSQIHLLCLALLSGVTGSYVGSTPVENTILKQQMNQINPFRAIQSMLQNRGPSRLWVGASQLAGREAGFATAMLYGGEAARTAVQIETGNDVLAGMAEIGVGIGGAALTHPLDTIATIRQKHEGLLSSAQAMKQIFHSKGVGGFFKGVGSRMVLFTGCATLIPRINRAVSKTLDSNKNSLNEK